MLWIYAHFFARQTVLPSSHLAPLLGHRGHMVEVRRFRAFLYELKRHGHTHTFVGKANCVAFVAFCTDFRPYDHGLMAVGTARHPH